MYHLKYVAVAPADEADAILDGRDYVLGIMTEIVSLYSIDTEFTEVQVSVRNFTLNQWDNLGTLGGVWVGNEASGISLPPGNCAFMRADSTNARSKGRKYLPPPSEADITDGLLTAAALALLANAATEYVSNHIAGARTWAPGVWSVGGAAFWSFSGTAQVSNMLAYQRRRKAGVGS